MVAAAFFGNHHARALTVLHATGYLSRALSASRFSRPLHALADWLVLLLDVCGELCTRRQAVSCDYAPAWQLPRPHAHPRTHRRAARGRVGLRRQGLQQRPGRGRHPRDRRGHARAPAQGQHEAEHAGRAVRVAHVPLAIETVNSQLTAMGIGRLHVRSIAGLDIKVPASLLALAYLNAN